MGLRETIAKAAQTAVAALGNVSVDADYLAFTGSTAYDVSSGTAVPVYSTVAGVRMTFTTFTLKEIDGQKVREKDKKALIPSLNIPGVTPGTEDRIVVSSVVWNVQTVMTDSADGLWKLHIREA